MSVRLSRMDLLTAAILLIGTSQANASYTVIDLGGAYSVANGINDTRQLVGGFTPALGIAIQATIWSGNAITYLNPLGDRGATAYAINNLGQSVGFAFTVNEASHAALWNGTTATDLGTLGGRGESVATAINDSGQVVGYSYNNPDYGGNYHAVRWNGTTAIDLGLADRDSSLAQGINNIGQVVGYAYNDAGSEYSKAILWNNTTAIELDTQGEGGRAYAINDAGQVVGLSGCRNCDDTEFYATLWDGNAVTNLGSLGTSSIAYDINNVGQVVGTSRLPEGGSYATLWNGTTMINLNDSLNTPEGWVLYNATNINNDGWITAEGYNRRLGGSHAFLLIPTALVPAAVPEPDSFAILLAGFGYLGWRMRRLH